MISGGLKGVGQAAEDGFAVVINHARLAMHKATVPFHLGAECAGDALMPQAYAEDGDLAGKMLYYVVRNAGFLRSAGTRRYYDSVRMQLFGIPDAYLIVAPHLDIRSKLSEPLYQVIGEGIIIVDYQNHILVLVT